MSADKASNVVVSKPGAGNRGIRWLFADTRAKIVWVVVVVLLLGAVGYWYFKPKTGNSSANNGPVATTTANLLPVKVKYIQMNDDDLTSEVGYLMGTKQYAEADKLISIQKDLNTDKTKLQLLSGVQAMENKKQEAAQTAEKIAGLGDVQPAQYELIGDSWVAAGDKVKAGTYYQKALAAYNAQKTGNNKTSIAELQTKIKELQ